MSWSETKPIDDDFAKENERHTKDIHNGNAKGYIRFAVDGGAMNIYDTGKWLIGFDFGKDELLSMLLHLASAVAKGEPAVATLSNEDNGEEDGGYDSEENEEDSMDDCFALRRPFSALPSEIITSLYQACFGEDREKAYREAREGLVTWIRSGICREATHDCQATEALRSITDRCFTRAPAIFGSLIEVGNGGMDLAITRDSVLKTLGYVEYVLETKKF